MIRYVLNAHDIAVGVETLAVMIREYLQKSRKKKSLFLLFLRLK
jgi:hypothetical protein